MEIAKVVALRSPDPKLQVGSILVSTDFKRILGWGYNGTVSGQPNTRISNESGKSGMIHSEVNCLLNSTSQETGLMFVSVKPCIDCARIIANSGKVHSVYYSLDYGNNEGPETLKASGIFVEQL